MSSLQKPKECNEKLMLDSMGTSLPFAVAQTLPRTGFGLLFYADNMPPFERKPTDQLIEDFFKYAFAK
jgi:hypothetical protein